MYNNLNLQAIDFFILPRVSEWVSPPTRGTFSEGCYIIPIDTRYLHYQIWKYTYKYL